MFNLHITLEMAYSLLLRAIAERGENHTAITADGGSGCVYGEVDGFAINPVCIVGYVFHYLGALRALYTPNDSEYDSQWQATCTIGNDDVFWSALAEFGITADRDAQILLRETQDRQDMGERWGKALDEAVEVTRNRIVREVTDTLPAVVLLARHNGEF